MPKNTKPETRYSISISDNKNDSLKIDSDSGKVPSEALLDI